MVRRNFLSSIPAAALLLSLKNKEQFPISCNTYNWVTFYRRSGKEWGKNLEMDIAEFAKTGIKAIEPNMESVEMAEKLIPILKKNEIGLPSIYVNSVLHEEKEVTKSIETILGIAKAVKSYGTKIIVTNPSPLKWGGNQVKTDAQLITQAAALDKLGGLLKQMGITLAYHTHDMEMLAGAREFHHMLQNTAPENMGFCFDIHWIYRGSQNSNLAVFDVLKMYGDRIVELHIRQSKNETWQETFSPDGDIDYQQLAKELKRRNIQPHLVIEQCLEDGSPDKLNVVEAHKIDLENIKKLFI